MFFINFRLFPIIIISFNSYLNRLAAAAAAVGSPSQTFGPTTSSFGPTVTSLGSPTSIMATTFGSPTSIMATRIQPPTSPGIFPFTDLS